MQAILKNYQLQRKILRLTHLRPEESLRRLFAKFTSSFKSRHAFPVNVSIEVTNNCNLACATCPQPNMAGERGFLNISLFRKIIDECSQYPSLECIIFTGFGEPLLHSQLISMIRYARSKKIRYVRTYTNGVLLNKENTEEILLHSHLDEITISLNAPNQEIYERIKRSPHYTRVTENIEYFLTQRKSRGVKFPFINLQILKLNDITYNLEEFRRKWLPLLQPGDCIVMKNSHSFAGQINEPGVGKVFASRRRIPCGQLWNYLFVSWNGDVIPCCVDPLKTLKIGNVADSSLKDLWHSPQIMHIRDIHAQGKYNQLPLCNECETWRYFN